MTLLHRFARQCSSARTDRASRRIGSLFALGSLCSALVLPPVASTAHAGSGKISQPNGPGTPIVVQLRVHLGFPPSAGQLTDLEDNARKASEVICDATDGAVRIEEVIVDTAGYGSDSADVLILPAEVQGTNFGTLTVSKPFGSLANKARIKHTQNGYLWGHELGHTILGLGEGYDAQRRKGRAYGFGPTFDELPAPGDATWEKNHTIMQHHNSGGSELSTPSNHDPLQGDDGWAYPGARGGSLFSLRGSVRDLADPVSDVFDGSSFGTAEPFLLEVTPKAEPRREFIDSDGDLSNGYDRLSSQWIYVYVDKTDDYEYTLYFGIDDSEIDYDGSPGVDGQLTVFDSLVLEFEHPGVVINGDEYHRLLTVDGLSLGDPSVTIDLPELYDVVFQPLPITLDLGSGGLSEADDFYFVRPPIQPADPYFWVGDFGFSSDGLVQTGWLESDFDLQQAHLSWNDATDRFETSSQTYHVRTSIAEYDRYNGVTPADESDWSTFIFNMAFRQKVDGEPVMQVGNYMPVGDVQPDPAADGCVTLANNMTFTNNVGVADHVYLVIDSSDSMSQEQESAGDKKSRWEWAKAAVDSFVKLVEPDATEVSVIEFDDTAQEIVPLSSIDIPKKPGGESPGSLAAKLDTMADADGGSDIWLGLLTAWDAILADGAGGSTAVMLLTDGEQTAESPHPKEVADSLGSLGIPVFVTPLGDFDTDGLGEVVESTNGEMFSADHKEELPIAYTEMVARFRGESLPELPAYAVVANGQSTVYPVTVEEGADRLNFVVSNAGDTLSWQDLSVQIEGPEGEVYSAANGIPAAPIDFSEHGHVMLASIDDPSMGEWTITISSAYTGNLLRAHHIVAHIEHPSPACRVRYDKREVSGMGDQIAVHVVATWNDVEVEEGVTYTASIRRPDGTEIPIPLSPIFEDEGVRGFFDDFSGAGNYEVTATCDVDDGARLSVGEIFPGEPVDPEPDLAPHFVRVDQSTFHGDYLDWALPPGGDCDDDGISDSTEGGEDTDGDGVLDVAYGDARHDSDGDGIPDACDPDSDSDERPDTEEPTGDLDGDGVAGRLDVDSDDDGDMDGVDLAPDDPAWDRYARGDFDGDGRLDYVRGEPGYDGSKGRVVVDLADGSQQSLNRNSAGIADTSYAGDEFGASVAVGDFNGDGWDDLAVGVPGDDVGSIVDAGSIHILYGAAGGLSASGDQVWHQNSSGVQGAAEAGDRFGTRLTAGDFDGNGVDDVVIGSPNEAVGSYADAGAVNVLYGDVGGVSSVDDLWYQGTGGVNGAAEGGDRFGDALAAGDFDADDYTDLAIGAPDEDYGSVADTGYVYALYGTTDGLSTAGDFGFFQSTSGWADTSEAGDRLGSRFWVADRDDDGYADLTVFVPSDGCGSGTHGYHVVYGDASGLSSSGNALECLEAYQKHL